MTVYQTNQLAGLTLDKAVAVAQGWQRTSVLHAPSDVWVKPDAQGQPSSVTLVNRYRPSINWVQAAPIIEQYVKELVYHECGGDAFWSCKVTSRTLLPAQPSYRATGPTALIAAMRAFVGFQLGSTVKERLL